MVKNLGVENIATPFPREIFPRVPSYFYRINPLLLCLSIPLFLSRNMLVCEE